MQERLKAGQSAIYLRHDVHNVELPKLIEFAESEVRAGFKASYFFMGKHHPRTKASYSFYEECETIHQIKEMGHDVGLHIDPFIGTSSSDPIPRFSLKRELLEFAKFGIKFSIGTMHGNSSQNTKDLDGRSLGWEFFEELSREEGLARVPSSVARKILASRTRLVNHGFHLFADLPMWSEHQFTSMNYVSDSSFRKVGGLNLEVFPETINRYYISESQPRGSSKRASVGSTVEATSDCFLEGVEPTKHGRKTLMIEKYQNLVESLATAQPLLFLSHPDFLL